jgi:hypothetical protein
MSVMLAYSESVITLLTADMNFCLLLLCFNGFLAQDFRQTVC